jgi:5-methylcytosine-specific restriction endonuclease McrA
MAKEWAKPFYNSKSWKSCRNAFRASKFYICEECGQPGREVHHKIELTPQNITDPNVTLNWDNLQLLCTACHNKTKGNGYTATQSGLAFDALGNLVKTDQK